MLAARLRQTVILFFLRPISKQFTPQFLELFDGAAFGFISRATFGQRLIHHVRDTAKSRQHVWSPGQSLFQSTGSRHYRWVV